MNALPLFHDEFQFTVTGQMPVSGTYDLEFMKSNVKTFGGAPKSPTYGHYPMEYVVDGDSCAVVCQGHINGPGIVAYNNTYLLLLLINLKPPALEEAVGFRVSCGGIISEDTVP